jgi:putative ABC transport system permease protein
MRGYETLLRLLPASFRAEYGAEMAAIFARRRRTTRGAARVAALWVGAASDVVSTAAGVHLDILRQDLRHVGRTLGRSLGFSLTVVAVAALGVGATTAAFSITDHVLVRPLPFPESHRLVQLWQSQGRYNYVEVSPANFRDWRQAASSFAGMGALRGLSTNLVDGGGEPERLEGAAVTADVLPLLGATPLFGRLFTEEDDREGAPGVVLLSHALWQRRFGADRRVIGRKIVLDDRPHEVIGVMPPDFLFPRREAQLWATMGFTDDDFVRRDDLYLYVYARLKGDVPLDQSRAEMRTIAARLEAAYPVENERTGINVIALRDQVSPQARVMLLTLLGAAACVLLIACTNLASLFLARALERRREIAVRAALGAGRERLVRQLLTESLVLAALGGALGLLLARAAVPLGVRLVPTSLPIAEVPPLDPRVLAFAALMTLVTAVGFGLAPALRVFRDTDAAGLRDGSRAGVGGRRERLRAALVVAEVTLSVVLLIGSGLLVRALVRLQAVDPGFRTEGVMTLRTTLPMPKYKETAGRGRFYARVLEEARALPGVKDAAYISFLPMAMPGGIWQIRVDGDGQDRTDGSTASIRYVTPRFFATLGVPILRGRDVSDADTARPPFTAVVSQSFASRYWPGQDPIGRQFRFGLLGSVELAALGPLGPFQQRTVVGVVGDVRVRGPERTSEPQVYLPHLQVPDDAMSWYAPKDLVVKTAGDPLALVPALRRIVAEVDPTQPVSDVRTLEAVVDAETAPRRVQVRVLGAFAGVAVLLAGIGIHGLLAFTVSSRSQEFGVRMALGAAHRDIVRLVLRHGLGLGAAGVALGLTMALGMGQGLQALLAGVSPRDALTFAAAAALALLAAGLGSLLPARRALRVDPLDAIRAE